MNRCYRCHLRMVYRDDDETTCLACGRVQYVRVVPCIPEPMGEPAKAKVVPTTTCRTCGVTILLLWKSRRYCSKSCRTTGQHQQRKQAKPWRELVLR